MIVTQDERFAPRYEVELPVELLASGAGVPIAARSVNLGAGGLCLEPGVGIADRTAVLCRVDTGGGSIEAQGEVAWQLNEDGAYRVGIRFSALTPAMALWLASVSRTSSKASAPSPSAPESDTQPMRAPIAEEAAAPTPAEAAAAPSKSPGPKAAAQLDLPIGQGCAQSAPAADDEEVDIDVPDSQVLFDDMPSPEARMMRPPVSHANIEVVRPSSDKKTVESFSPSHRVLALAAKVGRRGIALIAMCRAALGSLFGALRGRRGLRRFGSATISKIRVAGLFAALRKRKVQLAVAATAVVLLIGSGLFILLSGPSSAEPSPQEGTETAQADPNRSYWDPPVMPAPAEAPPDQEIVEARPSSSGPAPAPERATGSGPIPGGGSLAAGMADEVPLPEPPAIGEPESVAAGMPEPGSETARPPRGAEPMGEPVAARTDSEPDGTDHRMEPPRSTSRRAASSRGEARNDRHASRAGAREERQASRERHTTRAEPREERNARAQRQESRAEARTERRENRAEARSEVATRSASAGATSGAATGASDFRLNLSGTPGSIQHYPLANPNGIVIDVPELHHPGAATKLTSDDPRIRFVKILNRDSGVRFIVYVNGSLASYEVQASGRGLRVAIAAAN